MNTDQIINVLWSWLKVYLAAALTYVLAALVNGDALAWNAVAIAGLVAMLPVVINWLNAADPRYGRGYGTPAPADPTAGHPDEQLLEQLVEEEDLG